MGIMFQPWDLSTSREGLKYLILKEAAFVFLLWCPLLLPFC